MTPAFVPCAFCAVGSVLEINVIPALEKAQPVWVIEPAFLRLKVKILSEIVFQSYQPFLVSSSLSSSPMLPDAAVFISS
jgi:hypothetical protein